jgi:hypothetical protein
MDFFQKYFDGVFEIFLSRNAQNPAQTALYKVGKKVDRYAGRPGIWQVSKCMGGPPFFLAVCRRRKSKIWCRLAGNELIPGFQSPSFRSEGQAGGGVDLLKS